MAQAYNPIKILSSVVKDMPRSFVPFAECIILEKNAVEAAKLIELFAKSEDMINDRIEKYFEQHSDRVGGYRLAREIGNVWDDIPNELIAEWLTERRDYRKKVFRIIRAVKFIEKKRINVLDELYRQGLRDYAETRFEW